MDNACALAQAKVGLAMGAAGTDIAIEAAHVALTREDWALVSEALQTARRTLGVVKMNLAFAALYNVVGLALAAFGLLPPIYVPLPRSPCRIGASWQIHRGCCGAATASPPGGQSRHSLL